MLESKKDENNVEAKISGLLGTVRVGDDQPVRVIGVINLSQNSFYRGSIRQKPNDILETALLMQKQGADVIDVGARSTAPYRFGEVSTEAESRAIASGVRLLFENLDIPISVDTTRLKAASSGIQAGARIINDPFGLVHSGAKSLAKLVARAGVSIILTAHEARGPREVDPLGRVMRSLHKAIEMTQECGIDWERIIVDPGIGFFPDKRISNVEWNCRIIGSLHILRKLGRPLCVGVSRKKFIGMLAGRVPPEQRLPGSLAATAIAVYNGCNVVRTHDVPQTLQAIRVASEIKKFEARRLESLF